MLRIDKLRLRPGQDERDLLPMAAAVLRLPPAALRDFHLVRRSVDARRGRVEIVCAVQVSAPNEGKLLRNLRDDRVKKAVRERYTPPDPLAKAPAVPPVVVGGGPAGLFCAWILARAGAKPILLERGKPVEERRRDVDRFWRDGTLLPDSNVQFGEGGAGTFSDGKLNTGTRDLRHRFILGKLVEWGAPPSILVDARPHAGTDRLFIAMGNLRRELLAMGTDLRYGHRLEDLILADGKITGLSVAGPEGRYSLPAAQVVLAPGHSARDTVEMLHCRRVPLEGKPFAVGVRIEHRQRDMDQVQYGAAAGLLEPASYKLSYHTAAGRGVFSFCVCPGGQVVAAASEEGGVVTNGMSNSDRAGENINGGLLVSVSPADFGPGPLDGIAFQRQLERSAYALGGGGYVAPAQLVGDFLAGRPSAGPGTIFPTYRPGVRWTDLRQCLPAFITEALAEALPALDQKLPGFARADAVLTAVESRSSAPVRILRDDRGRSAMGGLYPCGEGAGYAGGIMSAAADGIRAAEHVLEELSWELCGK